jgi:hypothetical protein
MDLLYRLAAMCVDFMNATPGLFPLALGFVLAPIPVVALHELGHALAARRLLGGDVEVSVGNAGKLAELRLGQIVMSVNALTRPDRFSGEAVFDASRATARDVLLIALAGPAASLAGFLVTALAFSAAAPHGIVHNALWSLTFCGLYGVANLVPLTLRERRGGPATRTDGRLALDAARVLRSLA